MKEMKFGRFAGLVLAVITLNGPAMAQLDGVIDLDSSDGSVGVSGVATVTAGSNDSGTSANGTVLGGGGGNDVSVPLGGVAGGNSGAGVDLPGFGGTPGLPAIPGFSGNDGNNGNNGNNGRSGFNTGVGASGAGGLNGINGLDRSSRLQLLLRVLQGRAWARFARSGQVCLPEFGVANASGFVRPNERRQLQQLVNAFGKDIQTLQQMMRRCRNGQDRRVDIDRVIGVDLRPDGQVVVMTI